MSSQEYLTVGELAQRAGVTVRTIQYYDQMGLMSPSAKGPQNQRLYTEGDISDLYRILTLKYLGLPLADIKTSGAGYEESKALRTLINEQMDGIELSFQQLFKRLTTLKALLETESDSSQEKSDWAQAVKTIEEKQGESQFFWRLTGIREEEANECEASEEGLREEAVSKWHELIADTIRLMPEQQPSHSEQNRELARRYLELNESQQDFSLEQNFILMENIVPRNHGDGSFDALRKTVCEYLDHIVADYRESMGS